MMNPRAVPFVLRFAIDTLGQRRLVRQHEPEIEPEKRVLQSVQGSLGILQALPEWNITPHITKFTKLSQRTH
jgi:hypothetical protein